jgi:hypothetical protein
MKKKKDLLYDVLIDYVGFFYSGNLKPAQIKTAIEIFEALLDANVDVKDFIPIMRQMQFDLDMVLL